MKILGRKNGRMTSCFEILAASFFTSSKWCHAVLVITRITKLIGIFRLKMISIGVNSRLTYDHPGTKKQLLGTTNFVLYFPTTAVTLVKKSNFF